MEDDNIKNMDDKHLACVLMFDVSGSMNGEPIEALNKSLMNFKDGFKKGQFGTDKDKNDSLSAVDLCIMSFGGKGDGSEPDIQVLQEFAPANEMFYTAELKANGGTPMAQAIKQAMAKIEEMKQQYKDNDIDYFRPILICVTDGESTEDENYVKEVKEELKNAVDSKHLVAYGLGVGKCNMNELREFFGEKNVGDYRNKDIESSFTEMLELLGRSFIVQKTVPSSDDANKEVILIPI